MRADDEGGSDSSLARCGPTTDQDLGDVFVALGEPWADLDTLVCTRGPSFPLSRLDSRLMSPSCGSQKVCSSLRLALGGAKLGSEMA
jgi:hypothetical protein